MEENKTQEQTSDSSEVKKEEVSAQATDAVVESKSEEKIEVNAEEKKADTSEQSSQQN